MLVAPEEDFILSHGKGGRGLHQLMVVHPPQRVHMCLRQGPGFAAIKQRLGHFPQNVHLGSQGNPEADIEQLLAGLLELSSGSAAASAELKGDVGVFVDASTKVDGIFQS